MKRKLKVDIIDLVIEQRYYNEILSGEKIREYRIKSHHNWKRIGEVHQIKGYIWLYVGYNTGRKEMLIEFHGLDNTDSKSRTHYVLKLGNIISTDPNIIKTHIYQLGIKILTVMY